MGHTLVIYIHIENFIHSKICTSRKKIVTLHREMICSNELGFSNKG